MSISEDSQKLKSPAGRRALPHALAVACLLLFLSGIWCAARGGVSRLFSDYASAKLALASADEAVRISPSDPEAHYARAVVLAETGQAPDATKEFARAVALRPGDYFLWLELGRALDQSGDVGGAVDAFRQAVELAPHYAQPRWQIGNLLLRMGRGDEAFAELRLAARSDAALFPALVDLAWGLSGGDPRAVEQVVGAETAERRLQLARFFASHGSADAAVRVFHEAGGGNSSGEVPDQTRRAFISELIAQKRFDEAYEVWTSSRGESAAAGAESAAAGSARRPLPRASLVDGGFESEIRLGENGFGWQIKSPVPSVRVSFDADRPRSGSRSLRIDFKGASVPTLQLVSQLALVEPGARYRLSFAARTQDMVTGGLPVVNVLDMSGEARLLAQSKSLPSGTSEWQNYTLEFAAAKTSSAILVILQRGNCSRKQCPAFGSAWFDDFTLAKL